jgi:hypothetical protein
MGEIAMPILIRWLHDDDKLVRYCALKALRRMGNSAATFLVFLLRSQDRGIRLYSVQWLGRLDDPPTAVVDALLGAFEQDSDPSVRRYCVRTLARIVPRPASVLPLLRRAQEDPDSRVRKEALNALAKIEGAQ